MTKSGRLEIADGDGGDSERSERIAVGDVNMCIPGADTDDTSESGESIDDGELSESVERASDSSVSLSVARRQSAETDGDIIAGPLRCDVTASSARRINPWSIE